MIKLHPQILTKDGKEHSVVLPYEEFLAVQELLSDFQDLLELRSAKEHERTEPTVSLNELMRRYGMTG